MSWKRFINSHIKLKSTRFFNDPIYRSELMIYQGFFLNVLYALIKLLTGLFLGSSWYLALALYYFCLCVLRYSLLSYLRREPFRKTRQEAWRRYRLCGGLLFLLNQALTMLVVYMIVQEDGFDYPGVMIYAMAGYAFYLVTMAIVSLIRFQRFQNPILSAAKIINLCVALVTMLALETAMLSRFGDRSSSFARAILVASGGIFCAVVLCLAAGMVLRGSRNLKRH